MQQNQGICTMKRNLSFNQTVREAIALSLIFLMKTKPFSQITISEIAQKAGVSRSSIYRNFNTKEEILTTYVYELYHDFFQSEDIPLHFPDDSNMKDFLLPRFRFIRKHSEIFSVLYKNGMLYYTFEQMSPELVLLLSGQTPSISPYYIAMFSGSYAAIIARWIESNFYESEEEMVKIFSSYPR